MEIEELYDTGFEEGPIYFTDPANFLSDKELNGIYDAVAEIDSFTGYILYYDSFEIILVDTIEDVDEYIFPVFKRNKEVDEIETETGFVAIFNDNAHTVISRRAQLNDKNTVKVILDENYDVKVKGLFIKIHNITIAR